MIRKDFLARFVTIGTLGSLWTWLAPASATYVEQANKEVADNQQLATSRILHVAQPMPGSIQVLLRSKQLKDLSSQHIVPVKASVSRTCPSHVTRASEHNSWATLKGLKEGLVARLKDLDEESVDVLQVVSVRLRRFVCIRLDELWQWFAELYRQVVSMPTATPFGSPYVPNLPKSINAIPESLTKMLETR